MPLTNFTSQALQDLILDMGNDPNRLQSVVQAFTLRENDIQAMRLYWAQRNLFTSQENIDAIENIRSSNQTVNLNLWGRKAPGNLTQRQRSGSDAQTVFNFTPTYSAPIVEPFNVSVLNNALRQFNGNTGGSENVRAGAMQEFMTAMAFAIKNIYIRANQFYVNFTEANKWALGTNPDAGTIYTTYLNDAKRVPLSDSQNILQNIQIEAKQNNFTSLNTTPDMLYGATGMITINEYKKFGSGNQQNIDQFRNYFNAYEDNEVSDNANTVSTFYMIAGGGVMGYQRAFDYAAADPFNDGSGESKYGEDTWSILDVGGDTLFFNGLPPLRLELKAQTGYVDNFANLAIDESRIDIVRGANLVATFGAAKAPTTATDIQNVSASPIIKYELATT